MIVTTTPSLEGRRIVRYVGIASGEAIVGANLFRDLFASVRGIRLPHTPGGGAIRASGRPFGANRRRARRRLRERAGNAIVGVDLDYETLGSGGSMLMVCASGTAVVIE